MSPGLSRAAALSSVAIAVSKSSLTFSALANAIRQSASFQAVSSHALVPDSTASRPFTSDWSRLDADPSPIPVSDSAARAFRCPPDHLVEIRQRLCMFIHLIINGAALGEGDCILGFEPNRFAEVCDGLLKLVPPLPRESARISAVASSGRLLINK